MIPTKYLSADLITKTDNFKVISPTLVSLSTGSVITRTIQTTMPTAPAGSVLFSHSLGNVLKIVPLISNANTSANMTVFGWSLATGFDTTNTALSFYVPVLLYEATVSFSSTRVFTMLNTSLQLPNSYAPLNGNALTYSTTNNGAACVVVDALGSQYIDINLHSTNAGVCNLMVGTI